MSQDSFFKNHDGEIYRKVEMFFRKLREFQKWQKRKTHGYGKRFVAIRVGAIVKVREFFKKLIYAYTSPALSVLNLIVLLNTFLSHLCPALVFKITEQVFDQHVVTGVQTAYLGGILSLVVLHFTSSERESKLFFGMSQQHKDQHTQCAIGYSIILCLFLLRAGAYVCIVEFLYLLTLSGIGYGLVKAGKCVWEEL